MHKNYFQISAKNYYDSGGKMGELFIKEAKEAIEINRETPEWKGRIETAKKMMGIADKYFPQYIEEAKGYAEGAGVDLKDLSPLLIESDSYLLQGHAKCTNAVVNNGHVVLHTEDASTSGLEDTVCILKKTVGNITSFELFYYNTLGGTSISINSFGVIQAINTLFYTPITIGVPKNIMARHLMDSRNPEEDIKTIKKIKRATGYNHVFVTGEETIFDVEITSSTVKTLHPDSPFAHTNHCLLGNRIDKDDSGTNTRLSFINKHIHNNMNMEEMKQVLGDTSFGSVKSVTNERTIGKMILDREKNVSHVWLLREKEKGWVEYPIDFIPT